MPINRLLQNAFFSPDEIAVMVKAFEAAIRKLDVDPNHPAAEIVAGKVIELANKGGVTSYAFHLKLCNSAWWRKGPRECPRRRLDCTSIVN